MLDVVRNCLQYHDGYLKALLSTLRYFPMWTLKDTFIELYERKDFDNKRWIFVWGEKDTMCPMKKDAVLSDVRIIKVSRAEHDDLCLDEFIREYKDQFIDWLNE